MTEPTPCQWEQALWTELDALESTRQIAACGEIITRMTQTILTELADRRRFKIVEVLEQDDWDATRLAETIGSRRTTINRLAEEGRAMLREKP